MEIFLILLFAVGVLLIYAGRKPDTFSMGRKAFILAPPATVFPYLNSLREVARWSPFEKDPQMQRSFSGPDSGVGAKYTWQGNYKVGAGDIEIVQSLPDSRVVMRLNMIKPIKAVNNVTYELEAIDGGTEVLWLMEGPQPFISKVVNTITNCDKRVGRDFEQGLKNLKKLIESN